MDIRKYKAKSIQKAIQRIKEELGSDALILSTRRLPRSLRDPYGTDVFEVSAVAQKAVKGSLNNDTSPFREELKEDSRNFNASKPQTPLSQHVRTWESLHTEILGLKDMLLLMSSMEGLEELLEANPDCFGLYARLVKSGISERRARSFLQRCAGSSDAQISGPAETTRRVIDVIRTAIRVKDPFDLDQNKRHFAAFIGPTGVGKTTTIAKLAADLSLKQKRRVGLISIDSYRIGAVEQLKTYAAIIGLPCLSAFTREDLQRAVKQFQGMDIILIDTAGHSHLDSHRMTELGCIMEGSLSVSSHLVLSAAAKKVDMKEAALNFSVFEPQTYIFTKLDETRKRGGIIDQVLERDLPISFLTNGQKVPEDIVPASRKSILKLVLDIQ
jgi:flagellar biosynthesis protein FlhF